MTLTKASSARPEPYPLPCCRVRSRPEAKAPEQRADRYRRSRWSRTYTRARQASRPLPTLAARGSAPGRHDPLGDRSMTDIHQLIAQFRRAGAIIELGGGDRVRFKPGHAPLPPGLLEELRS